MPRELNPKHVSIGVLLGEINVTVEAEKCPKRNLFRLCVSASHICQHFAGYGSGVIYCHFPVSADIDSPYCENVMELADALYGCEQPDFLSATRVIQKVLDRAPDLQNAVFLDSLIGDKPISLYSMSPEGLCATWKLSFPITVAEFWFAAEKVARKVS